MNKQKREKGGRLEEGNKERRSLTVYLHNKLKEAKSIWENPKIFIN